jgi:hypothetical protein
MNLSAHEKIVRDALGGEKMMSSQALSRVIAANKLCDLHQFAPERHFDNAPNRSMICDRWEKGLKVYLDRAIELGAPLDEKKRTPKNRKGALSAFGAATHALADFYAHTNWVELGVERGDYETLAPLWNDTCHVSDFPDELQSGYFNLRHGLSGCPRSGPPAGYRYCHERLAKDYPDKGHGADYIQTPGMTHYELAMSLATRATVQLWEVLHRRIVARYGAVTDAEAVFFGLNGQLR